MGRKSYEKLRKDHQIMSTSITTLQPTQLWQNFAQLNAIPRASKKEEKAIQFVKSFGEQLGLETKVDTLGNVLIKKTATKGKEESPTLILQGHLDMVHQKNAETDFDFTTQGIQMYIDGDWVKAKGTTLGADNGIGVAAILSVLAAKDLVHPAIEALFTVDEEIGMTGAMGLQKDFLKGSVLLNLDSEEDDAITIGSAGGVDVEIEGTYKEEVLTPNISFFQLKLKGLSGGHSGVDIHLGKGNAIKLLNRVLFELGKKFDLRIHSIQGGSLTNAIPRACLAIIGVEKEVSKLLEKEVLFWFNLLQKENSYSDPKLSLELNILEKEYSVLPRSLQKSLIASLYNCPNGIYRMTPSMPNLVQSSNNLAKVNLKNGQFKICCHTRSFIESERTDLVNAIRSSVHAIEATVNEIGPYPGWNPDPNAKTLATAKKVYEQLYGEVPEIFAIHAGLECGILSEIYPHLEIISFGPNIKGAHAPDEALQISSTQKFWQFLVAILESL